MTVGDRDGPAIGREAALVAVERERSEAVDMVRGHSGHIVRGNGGRGATSGAECVQAPRGPAAVTFDRPRAAEFPRSGGLGGRSAAGGRPAAAFGRRSATIFR